MLRHDGEHATHFVLHGLYISAAVFVDISGWEGNPFHGEVKVGEDLSLSHLHHHEIVIPDVQAIELISRP